jgi:hypothetical protein
VYDSDEVYDQMAEPEQALESDQVYDQMAESEPASLPHSHETGPEESHGDVLASPDGVSESDDNEPTIAEHRIPDDQDERHGTNGEARYRRGSSVFP